MPADYLLIHHFDAYAETLDSYVNTFIESARREPGVHAFVLLKVKCKGLHLIFPTK